MTNNRKSIVFMFTGLLSFLPGSISSQTLPHIRLGERFPSKVEEANIFFRSFFDTVSSREKDTYETTAQWQKRVKHKYDSTKIIHLIRPDALCDLLYYDADEQIKRVRYYFTYHRLTEIGNTEVTLHDRRFRSAFDQLGVRSISDLRNIYLKKLFVVDFDFSPRSRYSSDHLRFDYSLIIQNIDSFRELIDDNPKRGFSISFKLPIETAKKVDQNIGMVLEVTNLSYEKAYETLGLDDATSVSILICDLVSLTLIDLESYEVLWHQRRKNH